MKQIFGQFCTRGDGKLDIYEFFDFFDLDHSLFIKRSFLLMDFDRGNGEDDETDEVSKSKARN